MDGIYEILHGILDNCRDFSEEMAGEEFEFFRRNGNARFKNDPMIRTQVFKSDEEASMADMSTPEGVEYMTYVARRLSIFGDK